MRGDDPIAPLGVYGASKAGGRARGARGPAAPRDPAHRLGRSARTARTSSRPCCASARERDRIARRRRPARRARPAPPTSPRRSPTIALRLADGRRPRRPASSTSPNAGATDLARLRATRSSTAAARRGRTAPEVDADRHRRLSDARRAGRPTRSSRLRRDRAATTASRPARLAARRCARCARRHCWRTRHEGHHSRRRLRHAALSGDARGQQAAAAGLRQADDLLSAVDADAGRHPRDPDHLHAATTCDNFRRLLGDGADVGPRRSPTPCSRSPDGLAQAFIIGARVRRRRPRRAGARRQHLLRRTT